jgi:hypothetical protein
MPTARKTSRQDAGELRNARACIVEAEYLAQTELLDIGDVSICALYSVPHDESKVCPVLGVM